MDVDTLNRIQYLAKKAQHGVITKSEQDKLVRLVGYDPRDYQGNEGLAFFRSCVRSDSGGDYNFVLLSQE